MANPVGSGVDRHTGRPVAGWSHVILSLEAIFTTPFGARVMRRWLGSLVPHMLGQNLTTETVLSFKVAIMVALLQEPRFRLQMAVTLSSPEELRLGRLRIELLGLYRPRAHLGDFTIEGPRSVFLGGDLNVGGSYTRPIVVQEQPL